MNKQKQAFTLVELIVVITILAILGTIAFISLSGYSAQARDSTRISDVSGMNTSLELFNIDAGKYPLPDNNNTVSYSGEILWYQGTFGTTVKGNVTKLDKLPLDPSTDKEYVYSVSGKKNSFQILNLLEGDVALNTNVLTKTNAATVTRIAKVGGVYNEVFVKTANYIVPTPSLITSEDITGGITLNSTNIKSQVITGGKNIPKTGNITTSTGGLNIILSVYNGTINKDSTDQQKIDAMKAIQGAYSGSTLSTSGVYKTMLEKVTDNDILAISKTVISDEVGTTTATVVTSVLGTSSTNPGTSCNNIKITLPSSTDGTYWIKPDSNPAFQVYCDMITDGGGWTLVSYINDTNSTGSYENGAFCSNIGTNCKGDLKKMGASLSSLGGLTQIMLKHTNGKRVQLQLALNSYLFISLINGSQYINSIQSATIIYDNILNRAGYTDTLSYWLEVGSVNTYWIANYTYNSTSWWSYASNYDGDDTADTSILKGVGITNGSFSWVQRTANGIYVK